jgi:exopolyphosphatase/pppGpp-phosphohydrolase
MQGRVAAAIDVGSNSVHLLVARLDAGALLPLADESVFLGLGDAVDRDGRLGASVRDELARALAALVTRARGLGADGAALLGTEPVRRAADRAEAQAAVERATGETLHVLSHEEEAALTLIGALEGEAPVEPTLVLDIGGGSSEVAVAAPGRPLHVSVVPTGSARLAARLVAHDPPTAAEVEALRVAAARLLEALSPPAPVGRGIVVGGSGRNLLLLAGTETIDATAIGLALERVAALPAVDLATRHGLRERRARQIAAGIALVEATMARHGLARMEVSDASLREGAILALARAGPAWREHLATLVGGEARVSDPRPPARP